LTRNFPERATRGENLLPKQPSQPSLQPRRFENSHLRTLI
jgi:hypothetical protein